ncbi:hypothetical protein CN326_21540 [Bacillus sp. AFS018417]|nr:hypothetical protein CN326_21540 [Bacillus sp. AFS018417]
MDVLPPDQQIKYVKPDEDYDFHSYRIILLIKLCGIVKPEISPFETLYGRRKFAFYDFLIRYPFYLEKAVGMKKKNDKLMKLLNLKSFEKEEVFSPMVKFIRGPWDFEYENIFNYLISKDLIEVQYTNITKHKKEFTISLTETGNEVALKIKEEEKLWVDRMQIINNLFRANATNEKIDTYIEDNFGELYKGLGEILDVN